jgi:hypothetical protein
MAEKVLERKQKSLDLLEALLLPSSRKAVAFHFRQTRTFAAEHDGIAVAHFDTTPVAQV